MANKKLKDLTKKKKSNKKPICDFSIIAKAISDVVGSIWAFLTAVLFVIIWLISGPFFNYSDTWQLIINTSTTIVTFLMVFLIQNSQNRDTEILNLKLDELIKSIHYADNKTVDLDSLPEEELEKLMKKYKKLKSKKTGE